MPWLWVLACIGGEPRPTESGGTDSAPINPEACAADVTWVNWVGAFLLTQCQGCHASTAPDRYGAPPTVSFDTEEAAIAQAAAISRTILESASMPPAGGLTDDERCLLGQWVACYIDGRGRS